MKTKTLLVAGLTLGLVQFVGAAEPVSVNKKNITIGGHDTVAYHNPESSSDHKAKKGETDLAVEYAGAIWWFTSEENRNLFLANPEKYRPAYGGHCANALSIGEGLIKTDGKTWEIFGDQLFVYFAPRGRKRWNDGNWETYKQDADRAWEEILANQ